jgi:hypothetical protein
VCLSAIIVTVFTDLTRTMYRTFCFFCCYILDTAVRALGEVNYTQLTLLLLWKPRQEATKVLVRAVAMVTDYRFDRSSVCEIFEYRFSSLSRLKHEFMCAQICVYVCVCFVCLFLRPHLFLMQCTVREVVLLMMIINGTIFYAGTFICRIQQGRPKITLHRAFCFKLFKDNIQIFISFPNPF